MVNIKKSRELIQLLFLLFIVPDLALAQGESAMPFVLIEPSPILNGMGRIGTALPNTESYGFYYNPAQLGFVGKEINFSFQFYPHATDWLPAFNFSDLTFNSLAANFGYNLLKKTGVPVSIGIGYQYTRLDLGENHITDENGNDLGSYQSYEYYHAFGLGAGIDYYVHFSAGLTYKRLSSNINPNLRINDGFDPDRSLKVPAIDYGFLLQVPLFRYFSDIYFYQSDQGINILPVLDLSMGYAKVNIGEKVKYIDIDQLDPLPRQVRLGYALTGGLDLRRDKLTLNLLKFDWSVDAHDMLITRYDGSHEYQSGCLGNIRIDNNLLKGESDQNVDVYKGMRFSFLEILDFSFGSWEGQGWGELRTSGYTISLKGLFKMLYLFLKNPDLIDISDHFNFRYSYSRIHDTHEHPLSNTKYRSIQLMVNGIF